MNSEKQNQKQIPRRGAPRNDGARQFGKRRGDKGGLTAATRNAMFAEWAKLSPNLDIEPAEGESARESEKRARMEWTNRTLVGKADPSADALYPGPRNESAVSSWSELSEAKGRYLLKRMREESGDGPAYRARMIAGMAQELFGAAWDRLLAERLRARFAVHQLEELTPRQAHEFMEEMLSRIARRDGVEIEEARARFRRAKL